MSDVDPGQFRDRWHSYVDDFDRLKISLDDEQADVLDDAMDQIHRVIDAAADQKGADR